MAHSSWQSWCNWARFVGLLARTHLFSSADKYSIVLRPGHCDGHSNTLTLLSLRDFATTFLPHDAIYFVKCTSPSCSLAPPQLDAASPVLHGWDGVLQLASIPLFPPNITMVIMAKPFYFFHQTSGHFSKQYDLCLHVQLQTVVWLFLWWFWSSGFFLVEQPFRLCRYRTCFTVDIDTFVPLSSTIFTRSFVIVLGLICTFHTKVRSSLWDRMRLLPERYDGCVVQWCLYLRTIVCTDECGTFRRNCSQGWTRLVGVYNFVGLDIHPPVHLQLTQMMSISLWHNILEFSKLLKAQSA